MSEHIATGDPSVLTADHLGRWVAIYHPDRSLMVRDQLARVEHGMTETELRNQEGNVFKEDRVVNTYVTMRTVGGIRLDPGKGPYWVEVES